MFKKIALCLLFVGVAQADMEPQNVGPVHISSSAVNISNLTQPPMVTVNQPGPGNRTCVTDISISANKFPVTWDFAILSGSVGTAGTTDYWITMTTGTLVQDFYKGNPLCLGIGATTYVYVSTGDWKINVNGYTRQQ